MVEPLKPRAMQPDGGPQTKTFSGSRPSPNRKPTWCFLCNSEHEYIYPCERLAALEWYDGKGEPE